MSQETHLLVCVNDTGAEDLHVLSVYRRVPDTVAEARGFVRIIDDSGEDYLYPESAFLPLPLPESIERELEGVAKRRAEALAV